MARQLHEFEPSIYYVNYGPHKPALRIAPGDSVRTTTLDAGGLDEHGKKPPPEMFQNEMDTELQLSNPQTGPIYVEIGWAAPQVGVHKQLLVIDLDLETPSTPPLVLINPCPVASIVGCIARTVQRQHFNSTTNKSKKLAFQPTLF